MYHLQSSMDYKPFHRLTSLHPHNRISSWQLMIVKAFLQKMGKTILFADQDSGVRQVLTHIGRCRQHPDRRAIICYGLAHFYAVLTEGDKPIIMYAPEGASMGFCPARVLKTVKTKYPSTIDQKDPKGKQFVSDIKMQHI